MTKRKNKGMARSALRRYRPSAWETPDRRFDVSVEMREDGTEQFNITDYRGDHMRFVGTVKSLDAASQRIEKIYAKGK
jgi:hypothetical protein